MRPVGFFNGFVLRRDDGLVGLSAQYGRHQISTSSRADDDLPPCTLNLFSFTEFGESLRNLQDGRPPIRRMDLALPVLPPRRPFNLLRAQSSKDWNDEREVDFGKLEVICLLDQFRIGQFHPNP